MCCTKSIIKHTLQRANTEMKFTDLSTQLQKNTVKFLTTKYPLVAKITRQKVGCKQRRRRNGLSTYFYATPKLCNVKIHAVFTPEQIRFLNGSSVTRVDINGMIAEVMSVLNDNNIRVPQSSRVRQMSGWTGAFFLFPPSKCMQKKYL